MPHCHTFLEELRRRGYRITRQRKAVVEVVAHSGRHMTAEEVASELSRKQEKADLATVYRSLELLVMNGLASKLDLGDGRTAYATGRHGPHAHLVCRRCGKITEVSEEDISRIVSFLEEKYDFDSRPYHFSLHGLCSSCRTEAG